MADDVVVFFSFDAFTRDELLARHLVGFGRLRQPELSTESSLVSSIRRILYQFIDSGTGCEIEVGKWHVGRIFEVVLKTRPSLWGGGVSECVLYKMSVKLKVEDASSKEVPSSPSERDHPAEETCTPVDKSLVIAVESNTQ